MRRGTFRNPSARTRTDGRKERDGEANRNHRRGTESEGKEPRRRRCRACKRGARCEREGDEVTLVLERKPMSRAQREYLTRVIESADAVYGVDFSADTLGEAGCDAFMIVTYRIGAFAWRDTVAMNGEISDTEEIEND